MKKVKKSIKTRVAKFLFGLGMIFLGLAMKIDKDAIGNFMLKIMGETMKKRASERFMQEMKDEKGKTEKD